MESVSDGIYHPIDKRRVLCQTGQRFGAPFFGFFFIHHHHHHHRGAAAFWENFSTAFLFRLSRQALPI